MADDLLTIDADEADVIETPVSLYFGFPANTKPELETIAEASVAWARAVRALVAEVEPGIQLRIELVDGEDGSLWLNTILRMIEHKLERIARGAEAYPRLKALAKGLAIIVVATPLQWGADEVWHQVVADEPQIGELSPAGQEQVRKIFEDVLQKDRAGRQRDEFAQTIARHPDLQAVSVASRPLPKPRFKVVSEQMRAYAERERLLTDTTRLRTITRDVILVRPVLEDKERRWRFREPGMPEFGAVMRDQAFLSAVARGLLHEELRAGIQMTIELEVKEQDENGIWVPLDRSVTRVIKPDVDRGELAF